MAESDALAAVRAYARDLTVKFRTLGGAQPEDQLKATVEALVAKLAGGPGAVTVTTEHRVEDLGRPDMAVSSHGLLCGFVELKAASRTAVSGWPSVRS